MAQAKTQIDSCLGQSNGCALNLGVPPGAEAQVLWRFEGIRSADLGPLVQRAGSSAGGDGLAFTAAVIWGVGKV